MRELTLYPKLARQIFGRWHFTSHVGVGLLMAGLSFLLSPSPASGQSFPPFITNGSPLLNLWTFGDTTNWTSTYGYAPLSFTNVTVTNNGPGNSLFMDGTNESQLIFGTWNSDGTTNLNVNGAGSVLFWFNPNWTSTNAGGSGPGGTNWSPLVDMGAYTLAANYGWWSCGFDKSGSYFYFITQDAAGHEEDYLYAPVSLVAGTWNLIALDWSSTNTSLYLNGQWVTNGPGISVSPSLAVISNGFAIGSDWQTGLLQMDGAMNDLSTYVGELAPASVAAEWALEGLMYIGEADGMGAPHLPQPPSFSVTVPAFEAITGSGDLMAIATNTSGCTSSTNIWITNTTASVSNGVMSVTFEIAGGSAGVPYDVFATAEMLSPLASSPWTWMGQGYQCVTYTIPALTNQAVFLILGTPQDSDGDGLTDAYELLVSHSNPYAADSSGDGMLDGWKVLWGMNPGINNPNQPSERANFTYDGTGRLETNSGVSFTEFPAELFGFDAEGNITADNQ